MIPIRLKNERFLLLITAKILYINARIIIHIMTTCISCKCTGTIHKTDGGARFGAAKVFLLSFAVGQAAYQACRARQGQGKQSHKKAYKDRTDDAGGHNPDNQQDNGKQCCSQYPCQNDPKCRTLTAAAVIDAQNLSFNAAEDH